MRYTKLIGILTSLTLGYSLFAPDFQGIYRPVCTYPTYPSSRGVYLPTRNFQSSYPLITASTLRHFANHILDAVTLFNPAQVKRGDVIFVQIDFLEDFIKIHRSYITEPYILLVHHFFGESDDPVPGPHSELLEDALLLAWFTHNVDCAHPKLHPLPIGIGDRFYPFGDLATFINAIEKKHAHPKNCLLCCSIGNCEIRKKFRAPLYQLFADQPFCTVAQPNFSLEQYLELLGEHKFVLSPRGHGLDCFKTWEALLMGSYPIVQTSTLDPLFEDLPVVIVKDFTEVTEEFLNKKYQELTSRTDYTWEKLFVPYWLNKIKKIQDQARA